MKRLWLVFFPTLFGLSVTAKAEIMVVASLEWMADHCPDSGIYKARNIGKGKNSIQVAFSLKRTLRGKPPEKTEDSYWPRKYVDTKLPRVQVGDEFLICFQHYRTGEVRSVHLINLTNPGLSFSQFIAVSCELKLLKSKKDILKVFEDRLKSHPEGDPVEIDDYSKDNRFNLAWAAEVSQAVAAGSSSYLRVPKDLFDKVKQQSELEAAKVLQQITHPR